MQNGPRAETAARASADAGSGLCRRRGITAARQSARAVTLTLLLASSQMAAADDAARSGLPARSEDAAICNAWATIAATEAGIPAELMRAIATVESGRRDEARPHRSHAAWPWTIGTGSGGQWFATATEALVFAQSRVTTGHPVDVGCFQLNYRWHGRAFGSLEEMLSPDRNARYAARFLAALYDEFGDWTRAAAAYHSRTPEHGRAYLVRLVAALESARDADYTTPGRTGRERGAAFPLVPERPAAAPEATATRSGRMSAPGSLVMPGIQGRPLFDSPGGPLR